MSESQSKPTREIMLGVDATRWSGRVVEVSEDRTSMTMRTIERDTRVNMPEHQTVPPDVAPGAYGSMSTGKDGPQFTPSRARSQQKELER